MSWWTKNRDAAVTKAAQVEGAAVAGVAQKTGLSARTVLFLLVLTLLFLGAGGYGVYWHFFREVKPSATLAPVQTQGGEKTPGYAAPTVKGLSGEPRRTTVRPIRSSTVADLPAKERGFAPVVAPAVGVDNVARKEPELLTSSVVPPWRGETDVRTWINPDGSAQNVLTPRNEPFFGFTPKRGAVGIGYGVGAMQMAGRGRWEPLRLGNVFVTAEGTAGVRSDGRMEGSVMGWVEYRFGR
jgi:hypothetical protein